MNPPRDPFDPCCGASSYGGMDRQPTISPEPVAVDGADDSAAPSFELRRAVGGGPAPTPLVSPAPPPGPDYPAEMMAASVLDARAIRRSEDAFVDDLIAAAPSMGVA